MNETEQLLRKKRRALAIQEARQDLFAFMRLMRPDPEDPEDVTRSLYEDRPQARLLCNVVEETFAGKRRRTGVSIGPQLGKSDILTRYGVAWMSGKNPRMNIMVGAYNQDFANDFGNDVKTILESHEFKQVFPEYGDARKASVDQIVTSKGGKLSFVGVGGSGTGKPADLFIVDDPIRNDDDAQSETYREKVWKWFNGVAFSRGRTGFRIIVVHTRWHEDDLLGRLCDQDHPERNGRFKGIAKLWDYWNLPAVVEDPTLAAALGLTLEVQTDPLIVQMFGTKPIAALSPTAKDLITLAEAKLNDSHIFSALYMGSPTPDDGDFFKADDLVEYHSPSELPKELEKYGASDHAVSEEQSADYTVIGCIGVDRNDDIWILPDVTWERMETDDTVEALLAKFKDHQPLLWWMESELISKSFGPFLYKRMDEENVYCSIDKVTPAKKKKVRARAIQGRIQRRKVHFPAFAPWWPKAKAELLKFPYGTHDDFVDFLAHIGQGLLKQTQPDTLRPANENAQKHLATNTAQWLLAQSKHRDKQARRFKLVAGW